MTWPGLFRCAFEEAMTPPNILSGFTATGIYPWNPLAIPVSAFLPNRAFAEGSMHPATDRHPLAWVMDKVAHEEATITLEAVDNNVLSVLQSSVEHSVHSATESTPREEENTDVHLPNEQVTLTVSPQDGMEHLPCESPALQISPILPLDSGIRLEDVLKPEVTHFLSADMNDLMSQVSCAVTPH